VSVCGEQSGICAHSEPGLTRGCPHREIEQATQEWQALLAHERKVNEAKKTGVVQTAFERANPVGVMMKFDCLPACILSTTGQRVFKASLNLVPSSTTGRQETGASFDSRQAE
jgi:hypothetical protein